jgi:putative two-component system response regulator
MRKFPSEVKEKELIDAVRRMAGLAEYNEPDTASHRERIREYCFLLASCHELSSYDAEVISYASLLHDVGKIGLPETLTSKSGDLTPYEWNLMQKHTTIGADILRGSPSVIMQAAEIIALTHHERWDGSGYPNGMRGEEIPLSGRICALADVFDALTSKRPYKEAVPVEEAFRMIQEVSGKLFDPSLVKTFMQNRDELKKIRNIGTAKLQF